METTLNLLSMECEDKLLMGFRSFMSVSEIIKFKYWERKEINVNNDI